MSPLVPVILALAGAPVGTPVACTAAPVLGGSALAVTTMVGRTPESISLSGTVCRLLGSRLPGAAGVDQRAVGAFVVLREAVHASGVVNECVDDERARPLVRRVLGLVDPGAVTEGLRMVVGFMRGAAPVMGCRAWGAA